MLYTFTVNQTSGVIEKTLSAKKDGERFILHTNDGELLSSDYNVTDGKFVAELRRGEISSDLVLLDTERGDYVSITDGDSRDENPSFSKKRPGVVLYDSLAAGRNARGEFVEYAPAAVYEYDLNTLDLKEIRRERKIFLYQARRGRKRRYLLYPQARQRAGTAQSRRGDPAHSV